MRMVHSVALSNDRLIRKLDVNNVFLNGELEEVEYMIYPNGFEVKSDKPMVCTLRKAIYGLKQAPRAWFKKFTTSLIGLGFENSKYDASLFF